MNNSDAGRTYAGRIQFKDLYPGERFALNLSQHESPLLKTGAQSAHAHDGSHISYDDDQSTSMLVYPVDREEMLYPMAEEPALTTGLYYHYKRGLCTVVGTATDHDDGQVKAVFFVHGSGKFWIRALAEFQETVKVLRNGAEVEVPRFELVRAD